MEADAGSAWHLTEDRQQPLEPGRACDRDFVDECQNEVVGVLQRVADRCQILAVCSGRAGVTVFDAVELSDDRSALRRLPYEFVISHSFLLYAASMPKSEPAKVATSPKPTSSDSWIWPCGSM